MLCVEKIHRLVNFILPVTACNFRCHYCYVRQEEKQTGKIDDLDYSLEHIQHCMTKERWGGVCHINMCGLGETLLADYAVELAIKMLENGHYVSVVTNGTITRRIKELCSISSEQRQRLFFKFSFHYLELINRNMMNTFWENVSYAASHGCAYTVELTVNDELIPYIPDIRKICKERVGADCHVIESRNNLDGFSRLTKLNLEEHQKAWGKFNSELFEFQQSQWMKKRHEFCYAGDYIVSLNVGSGWLMPCFSGGKAIQNIFVDSNEPIHFAAIGRNCQWTHCYAAYVLMSSGVIPSIETPTYALLRDRVCSNGSRWLTPEISNFFSTKINQSNPEYTKEKEMYINALMAKVYNNSENHIDYTKLSKIVANQLKEHEIKSIAFTVNGRCDEWTEWLYNLLKSASVKILYAIDIQNSEEVKQDIKNDIKKKFKYHIKSIYNHVNNKDVILLNKNDYLPPVDLMLVTDYIHISIMKNEIPKVYKSIYPITELFDI